jgi:hypothetical protein
MGGHLLTPATVIRYTVLNAASLPGELYRIDPAGVLAAPLPLVTGAGTGETVYHTDVVLGEDAAWAYVEGHNANGYYAKTVSFDPVTLAVHTQNTLSSAQPQRLDLRVRSALAGGGIYLSGPAAAFAVGATVPASGFAEGGHGSYLVGDAWSGWNPSPGVTFGSDASEGLSAMSQPQGDGNRNAPKAHFDSFEEAALAALDLIYPYSAQWEWGGLICQQGARFLWSRFVTDRQQSEVNIDAQVSCNQFGPFGVDVAQFHTHPPVETNVVPSPGDFANANAKPDRTFYLRGSVPGLTQTTRYRKTAELNAQDNLFKYENRTWVLLPNPWP